MDTILTRDANQTIVCIKGRFATDEAASFLKKIDPLMQKDSVEEVVMDLAELEFISSAGIRCFVMFLKACEVNGSTLRLRNLTPQLKDIFSLTALLDKFTIEQ